MDTIAFFTIGDVDVLPLEAMRDIFIFIVFEVLFKISRNIHIFSKTIIGDIGPLSQQVGIITLHKSPPFRIEVERRGNAVLTNRIAHWKAKEQAETAPGAVCGGVAAPH